MRHPAPVAAVHGLARVIPILATFIGASTGD